MPSVVREDYLERVEELFAFYTRELRLTGIDYRLVDTSKPRDLAVLSYLSARSQLY